MKTAFDDILKNALKDREVPSMPDGHTQRFSEKLARQNRRRTVRQRLWVLSGSIAAMLTLVVLTEYYRNAIVYSETTDPVNETLNYYRNRMNFEIDKICNLASHSETEHALLLKDLKQMQNESACWEQNLPPLSTEKQIAAIVTRYKMQLESLEKIEDLLQSGVQKGKEVR